MKIIDGGVCAAKGFTAGSIRSGIKDSRADDDTAIIFSACECTAAATYTMNRVKAAPVRVSRAHLRAPHACAVLLNSGNANACTGPCGVSAAKSLAVAVADVLDCGVRRVLAGRAGAPKAAGSGPGPAAPMSWPAYRARRIARGRAT